MAAISEALDTYTRLAKANPHDFEPELHQAIKVMAELHDRAGSC
jgi:hypothetical protein